MLTTSWVLPPKKPNLNSNEVHVWCAFLDIDAGKIEHLHQTLSTDEKQRATRFYLQKHREHFIVARGLLRVILSGYLNTNPKDISFCYKEHGKPALITADGEDRLQFNLSHSQGIALYAVTQQRPIGIDIERIRSDFPCLEIAQQFFSPRENAMLRSLPPDLQHQAFFTCWTRKEAYIKAIGKGLSMGLDQFEVSLLTEEPALLSIKGDIKAASHWSLQDLNLSPDYAAAIAIEKHNYQLKTWQWIPEENYQTTDF